MSESALKYEFIKIPFVLTSLCLLGLLRRQKDYIQFINKSIADGEVSSPCLDFKNPLDRKIGIDSPKLSNYLKS
jgi:hypothetical protein